MFVFAHFFRVFRNADAGAAGGADGGAASGASELVAAAAAAGGAGAAATGSDTTKPDAGGGAPAASAPDAAATPYLPEGLPETLRGTSDKETLDKVAQHLKGLPAAPTKAEEYQLALPKELDGMVDAENDTVLPMMRDIALKHGLSQQQFSGVIGELFAGMVQNGMLEKPVPLDDQFVSLSDGKGDRAAQIESGKRTVVGVIDALKGMVTREVLSKEDLDAGSRSLADPQTVRLMSKLIAQIPQKEGGPSGGGAPAGGAQGESARLARLYPTMNGAA